jgi:hypothetical protein
MRLTLRTMLAYLDEQLEPVQMEEIGQKIRESGVASGMIERVRTTMRKHRMEAPRLDGRGIGKDANSVSEYLDNVLDKDEIPELEQLCLNSDMHLAEVAACHQILSLLPKVDLEVPPQLRERMYDIPSRLHELAEKDARGDSADAARPKYGVVKAPGATTSVSKKKKKKRSPKVPEYFKQSPTTSNSWLPLILTASVVVLGLCIGLYATRDQWLKNFTRQTASTAPSTSSTSSDRTESDVSAKTDPNAPPEPSSEPPTPPVEGEGESAEKSSKSDAPAENEKAPTAEVSETNPIIESDAAPPPPLDDAPPPPPGEGEPESKKAPIANVAPFPLVTGDLPAITWDSAVKGWRRVGKENALTESGFIALAGTRTRVKTGSGLTVTFVGPGEVRFPSEEGKGDALWFIEHGRMLVDAKDAGGAALSTNLAGHSVTFKFVSPDGQAAIEIVRNLPPGADPANPDATSSLVQVFVLKGAIEINLAGNQKLIEGGPDGAAAEIDSTGAISDMAPGAPLWADELTEGESAKQASIALAKGIADTKNPLSITLQELAAHKQVNVAALASQALAQLGQIKPLCDQFRDNRYRSVWPRNHAFLKQLIRSSPGNAEMVRQQLEEHFPSESEAVYRLLRDYDQEQFAQEGGELIAGLESENSLRRILAYQTLIELVGPGGRKYQPDEAPAIRAKHVAAWVEAFNSGRLKLKDATKKSKE